MQNVTVENQSADQKEMLRWQFFYSERSHALTLTCYIELTRPSTRHKFRAVKSYQRSFPQHSNLKLDDVIVPDAVRRAAVDKFVNGLRVLRGDEK